MTSKVQYPYDRQPLSKSDLGQYLDVDIIRCLNDKEVGTFKASFLSQLHCDTVLKYWNQLGVSMSQTHNPVDGKFYHWSYRRV